MLIILSQYFFLYTGEIQGAYQIKVTTSALALLLSTKSAALANINVQGHPLKVRSIGTYWLRFCCDFSNIFQYAFRQIQVLLLVRNPKWFLISGRLFHSL